MNTSLPPMTTASQSLPAPSSAWRARLALALGLCVLALSLASWTAPSGAGQRDHELARQALEKGQVLPLRTVLDRVEHEYQGQVIKVEFEHDDGRFIYEIRVLQAGGKVSKLKINAQDGSLISLKRKDR